MSTPRSIEHDEYALLPGHELIKGKVGEMDHVVLLLAPGNLLPINQSASSQ
jgi:hypothetical protein